MTLDLDAATAFTVLGHLQLALRHPDNDGPAAAVARAVAIEIQAQVAVTPALAQVAAAGWCPAYDVEEERCLHSEEG